MTRIAIISNFNDTAGPALPVVGALPAAGNPLPAIGGEINEAEVTNANFNASNEKPYGRTATSGTEARFLQRRVLGLC